MGSYRCTISQLNSFNSACGKMTLILLTRFLRFVPCFIISDVRDTGKSNPKLLLIRGGLF